MARWSPGFINPVGPLGFGGRMKQGVPGGTRGVFGPAGFRWPFQVPGTGAPPGLQHQQLFGPRPLMGGGAVPPPLPVQAAPAGAPAPGYNFYGIPTQQQLIALGQAANPTPTAMTTPSPYAPQYGAAPQPMPPNFGGGRPPWLP